MPMQALRKFVAVVFALAACDSNAQAGSKGIGYRSVSAALEAVKAKIGADVSIQGGWTIISENGGSLLWSFTPAGHPAHPAAIRRAVVAKDGGLVIEMSALCEASKQACDRLIAEFRTLNERVGQSIRAPAQTSVPHTDSQIEFEKIDQDTFRLVLKSKRSASVQAGQLELMPKARDLCATRFPVLGKYQFEQTESLEKSVGPTDTFILKQEIKCETSDPSDIKPVAQSISPTIKSDRPRDQKIEAATLAYFALLDKADYEAAYARQSTERQSATSLKSWTGIIDNFNVRAGPVISRTIKKVTWYQNPQGVQPGSYAAVDFLSEFTNLPYHCGYVVWREDAAGLQLVREETNSIDKDIVKKLAPDKLEALITRFKCK